MLIKLNVDENKLYLNEWNESHRSHTVIQNNSIPHLIVFFFFKILSDITNSKFNCFDLISL